MANLFHVKHFPVRQWNSMFHVKQVHSYGLLAISRFRDF